jgi:CubicO group peptidase (beta-lactamase class C family)
MAFVFTSIAIVMVGVILFLLKDGEAKPVVMQLEPGPSQPRVSPGEAGMDPAALALAVDYAGERNSSALVVGRGGHIVFEKYWGDTTFDTPVDPGFAPVLAALVTGTVMNDRLIVNLDQPVSNYLGGAADPQQAAASMRELLAGSLPGHSLQDSTDLVALVLERLGRQPYQSLVVERLWKPMGGGALEFRVRDNPRRPQGVSAACCVRARIGDWMRIGELLANDGVFEGNQYAPPRFVSLMLRPAYRESPRGFHVRVDGTFAARDVAWLDGTDQQRMWIVPSLKLVILRLGGESPASKEWDEAWIPDSVIRGTSGWQPQAAGEGIDPGKFAPH